MKRHLFALLLAASCFARADLGDADPTFGVEGVAGLPTPTSCGIRCSPGTMAMARQPDGKILAIGYAQNDSRSGFSYSVHVRRFLADGAPDATFNSGVPHFGGVGGSMSEYDRAIAVQSDGKILAAGGVRCLPSPTCVPSLTVVRMLDDGTLDPTFGTAGKTAVPVTIQNSVGMAVLPDGRIVVAARQAVSSAGYLVYRFTAAGALDTTFGSGGSVSVSVPGDNGSPYMRGDFAVLADGRMFLAHLDPMTVVRLTAEGAADTAFNGIGSFTIPTSEAGEAMLANEDGSVFVASSLYGTNFSKVAGRIRRLNSGGSLDTSWGQGGARDFFESFVVRSLGRQADGRLVAMGSTAGNVAFRRWLTNGLTDGSLRGAGYAISTVAGSSGARTQFLMLPDDKALALFGSSLARFGGAYDIDDDRLFVAQQFRDFLGRAPDQAGVDFWAGRLSSGGLTRAQLVEEFFNSPEFDGIVAPVVRLYFAYFMRFPDFPGLLFWTGAFRQGTNLGGMSWSFAQSAEFMQLYGPLDNGQFVSRVYQNVLGRYPDAEGLIYWRNRLDTGSITRGDMMASFSESPEFRSVVRNEVFVAMIYAGMLRRAPDTSGFMFWVGQLDAGNSSAGLTQAVLDSEEYEGRFAQ